MEHKYNQLSIERYSTSLAKLLCDRYFSGNPTVNGQQLISFAPVKQINLFVIKELMLRWNQEMAHLKSPYFDFENEEVKEALVQFMNVLSRKILIKRPHFEPLLTKAIQDTIWWVADPAQVFSEKFLQGEDGSSGEKLQSHLKYIQINKAFIKDFIDNLPAGILPAGNLLNQFKTYILRNKQDIPYGIDNLIAELNPLLPLTETDLLEVQPEPIKAEPVPESKSVSQSYFDDLDADPAPEIIPAPAIPVLETPAFIPPAPLTVAEPVIPAAASQASALPAEPVKPVTTEGSLLDKFRDEKPTLNDRFTKPTTSSLAESQMSNKIESLKNSISINQRFGFINELFNGENLEYYNVIQTLDAYTDPDSAKNYVTQDLANKYNWSKKEEHVSKLLRLIERKFA